MNQTIATMLQKQVEEVLHDYQNLKAKSHYDDLSGLPADEYDKFLTRAAAVISKIPGSNNSYAARYAAIQNRSNSPLSWTTLAVAGVLQGLNDDLKGGYVQTLAELVHAELFSEYIEMARHLVENTYKDAAAVIAGSSLEVHLRALCTKYNISTVVTGNKRTVPKKADVINADLCKAGAYTMIDQKNITAWLDLRNKAAHGDYTAYDNQQVKLMIDNISNFMARVPA